MKHLFSIFAAVFTLFVFLISCGGSEGSGSGRSGNNDSGETGSIYGVVTDKATGESIINAGVELQPVGLKTVTGSDGQFEFNEVAVGTYTLFVTKTGYFEQKSSSITVESGKQSKADVQLENGMALPTLNTLEASKVKSSSAILNAEILTKGVPSYSKRGFVYALESNPTLENTISDLTAAVTEENTYSATVTGLELGKEYYVRAYAINEVGVAYSVNEVIVLPEFTIAEVTTEEVTNIDFDSCSVTFNGTIVDAGDPVYTERGFVYGEFRNPTVEDDAKKIASGNGTGAFSANVRELALNTTYYIRAYAINDKGVGYGNEITLNPEDYLPYVTVPGTTLIVAKEDAGQGSKSSAVEMCESSTLAGFNDWRLPTKSELLSLYNKKYFIGNFKDAYYWSYTPDENGSYYASIVDFSNGNVYSGNNVTSAYVRCVRTAE